MSASDAPRESLSNRFVLIALGAGAGLALWFVADVLPDLTENDRLFVAFALFVGGYVTVLLATIGRLGLAAAAGAAALLAAVSTLFVLWAGLRFDTMAALFERAPVYLAYLALIAIPIPFTITARLPATGWRDYPTLFRETWSIVVRFAMAWSFVGIFWGLLFLSNAVLQIVGLAIIEKILTISPVPYVLTGAMLGLALAVVQDVEHMLSPDLLFRLLRLLLPLVFVVSLIFVVAAPLNGLSALFGGLSAATTLMAMAGAAVTLVTVALDQTDAQAARARVLTWSARLMSLLVPILGGLAVWATMLRIGQYGLTPNRLAAILAAAITLAYGLSYALAVLRGPGWQARIRRANVSLALGLVALGALWLSPALNAERLSARSQITRFEAGKLPLPELDLWTIAHDWGRAGAAAVQRLRAPDHPRAAVLAPALARLDEADTRASYVSDANTANAQEIYAHLRALMPVRPAGKALPDELTKLAASPDSPRYARILDGCRRRTPAGAPGCVAVFADFGPSPGEELIVVHWSGHKVNFETFPDPIWRHDMSGRATRDIVDPGFIDDILEGQYTLAPAPFTSLYVGQEAIGIRP